MLKMLAKQKMIRVERKSEAMRKLPSVMLTFQSIHENNMFMNTFIRILHLQLHPSRLYLVNLLVMRIGKFSILSNDCIHRENIFKAKLGNLSNLVKMPLK